LLAVIALLVHAGQPRNRTVSLHLVYTEGRASPTASRTSRPGARGARSTGSLALMCMPEESRAGCNLPRSATAVS
jgi:hypothetical protein